MQLILQKTAMYTEWRAPRELADALVCTWSDAGGEPRAVMPDACIDIVWDGDQLIIAGPDTRPVSLQADGSFVGIRFRPGVAPAFLDIPASELLDARIPLREFWRGFADELVERLAHAADPAALLTQALVERRARAADRDPLVEHLVRTFAGPRQPNVFDAADALGVSERTLRRRCEAALGYGPKTLERILRFRRALRLLHRGHALADASAIAGYVDQSHFTNECRRLAGTTPATFARAPFSLSANGCN
ncbi:MAG: helix-turn-helix domain-containing protein [Chloroflexi bacterium]|nr:helix-turn-helix domain-containing protein [Chloroflexota bacterium]MBV9546133.1 helix-turn-helix domain-containing protein [Chloroflexota bacterium]